MKEANINCSLKHELDLGKIYIQCYPGDTTYLERKAAAVEIYEILSCAGAHKLESITYALIFATQHVSLDLVTCRFELSF